MVLFLTKRSHCFLVGIFLKFLLMRTIGWWSSISGGGGGGQRIWTNTNRETNHSNDSASWVLKIAILQQQGRCMISEILRLRKKKMIPMRLRRRPVHPLDRGDLLASLKRSYCRHQIQRKTMSKNINAINAVSERASGVKCASMSSNTKSLTSATSVVCV